MPARKRRSPGRAAIPITRAALARLRNELARMLHVVENNARVVEGNADELAAMRRDVTANVRRCAELQADIDRLKKQLVVA